MAEISLVSYAQHLIKSFQAIKGHYPEKIYVEHETYLQLIKEFNEQFMPDEKYISIDIIMTVTVVVTLCYKLKGDKPKDITEKIYLWKERDTFDDFYIK